MTRQTRCIDCNAMGRLTSRPAYKPGPRCEEDWRAEKKRRSTVVHGKNIDADFGITEETYQRIYVEQECRCFICRKATGKTKRLAVDHDHDCDQGHDRKLGCPRCIRALLCGRCNKLVAFLDAEALGRAIIVLEDPPAQRVLRKIMEEEDWV